MIEKQEYRSITSSMKVDKNQYSSEKSQGKPGLRLHEMAKKRIEQQKSAIELAKQ